MAERRSLRIGSRRSALAMWQAEWVKARLEELHPRLAVEIIGITSQGDVDKETPLPQIGGKGLFTQELDRALLGGDIDLAVHSLKDLPTKPTDGLQLGAVPEREDSRDVFVGKNGLRLEDLPEGARVGTSSLRRRAMVRHLRPDVEVTDLRGNVGTRLRRVQEDDGFHGAVLAYAGLHRLGLLDDSMQVMDLTTWVPAVSQGALGVVTREADESVLDLVRAMEHAPTRAAVTAERALLARLEGGCHVPVGGHARMEDGRLVLRSLVADPAGVKVVRDSAEGAPEQAEAMGREAAERLLAVGAAEILVSLENWRIPGGERTMNTTETRERSTALFERARNVMVGGVNSPVRAFRSVGGDPVVFAEGRGSKIIDVDGNEYIDCVGSWGPLILGHCDPRVVEALIEATKRGSSFGANCEVEIEMAETVREFFPSLERVRMVNSGTEATMSALRLARGFTGRDLIIKFEGCYHGHGDAFLIKAGSGALTLGVPDSKGVPASTAQSTLTAQFNDLDSVREQMEAHPGQVAGVIVEPIAGNMGCVPPAPGFLEGLRDLCDEHGALLIFDEVMTGFRVAPGGAQELYGVKPHLTTLGKIIGGGLPVGAYGGSAEIMSHVSPEGPVYQAGTLSGNPLGMAAGLATLRALREPGLYERLEERCAPLGEGLLAAAKGAGVPATLNRVGSMLTLFFTDQTVTNYAGAKSTDTEQFGAFFRGMLDRGVYLPPAQFEALFISAVHTEKDIEQIIEAAKGSLNAL